MSIRKIPQIIMYKLFILMDCGLYLFEWEVLSDCLYDEVSRGQGGLAIRGQHQLA